MATMARCSTAFIKSIFSMASSQTVMYS
jgi:hypothetical protein